MVDAGTGWLAFLEAATFIVILMAGPGLRLGEAATSTGPAPARPAAQASPSRPAGARVADRPRAAASGRSAPRPPSPQEARPLSPTADDDLYDPELQQSVILTKVDWVKDWGRRNALWPMAFGLACCAMEMMATAATKYDLDRFGVGRVPRLAAAERPDDRGRHRHPQDGPARQAALRPDARPQVRDRHGRLRDRRRALQPSTGYHVVQGVDLVIPVDIYLPGCPPRPEALIDAIRKLQERIRVRGGKSLPRRRPPEDPRADHGRMTARGPASIRPPSPAARASPPPDARPRHGDGGPGDRCGRASADAVVEEVTAGRHPYPAIAPDAPPRGRGARCATTRHLGMDCCHLISGVDWPAKTPRRSGAGHDRGRLPPRLLRFEAPRPRRTARPTLKNDGFLALKVRVPRDKPEVAERDGPLGRAPTGTSARPTTCWASSSRGAAA